MITEQETRKVPKSIEELVKLATVHNSLNSHIWVYAKPTPKKWRWTEKKDSIHAEFAICPQCYSILVWNKVSYRFEPLEKHLKNFQDPLDFLKGFFEYYNKSKYSKKYKPEFDFNLFVWVQAFQIKI